MKLYCYKVKVKTTNGLKDTCCVRASGTNMDTYIADIYYECIDGFLYVVCASPSDIAKRFGDDIVESIEKLGIGYQL